jgi:hypothetical protein
MVDVVFMLVVEAGTEAPRVKLEGCFCRTGHDSQTQLGEHEQLASDSSRAIILVR